MDSPNASQPADPTSTRPNADKLFMGGILVYVTSVLMFLFWQWRSRIPYAVQLLRTTVTFLQAYPGPVRVGTLSPHLTPRSHRSISYRTTAHAHTRTANVSLLVVATGSVLGLLRLPGRAAGGDPQLNP